MDTYDRVETGLWSLDRLLANRDKRGLPIGIVMELYGYPGAGKSTLAYYLAAKVAGDKTFTMLDLEKGMEQGHFDATLKHAGFTGTPHIIEYYVKDGKKKVPKTDEKMLQETIDSLYQEDIMAVIIDSLGVVTPLSEVQGDLGDANWGKRAQLIAQVSRRALYVLRLSDTPKLVIYVNHQYEAMGGMGKVTPGGKVKEFVTSVRLAIWKKESLSDGTIITEVKCDKKKQGGVIKDRRAQVCIINNFGVSPNMTAVVDCLEQGLAEKTKTGFVKMDGKSYGRMTTMVNKAEDDEFFQPFKDALEALSPTLIEEDEDDD